MRVAVAVTSAVLLVGAAARAAADMDMDLCCDSVAHPDGSCVASSTACPPATGFALDLHNISSADEPACQTSPMSCDPSYLDVPFPAGVDGYTIVTTSAPWTGLCLLPPDASDPQHLQPAAPLACITTFLDAGVGAEQATWQIPTGPWDAIERCFGAKVPDATDPTGFSCMVPGPALRDTTLSVLADGSCCGPPVLLADLDPPGVYAVNQEIPNVLTPPQQMDCTSAQCGLNTSTCPCYWEPPVGGAPIAVNLSTAPPADAGFAALAAMAKAPAMKAPAPADDSSSGCSVAGSGRGWSGLLLLALATRRRRRG